MCKQPNEGFEACITLGFIVPADQLKLDGGAFELGACLQQPQWPIGTALLCCVRGATAETVCGVAISRQEPGAKGGRPVPGGGQART